MLKELYEKFMVTVLSVLRNKKGQTLVEYALLLVLIAIVVYLMLKGTGLEVNCVYSKINSALGTP
jgi:pilus assembly protein Flp/PilA